MPHHVSNMVDDDPGGLAVQRPQCATKLLDKQTIRLGWSTHADHFDGRHVQTLTEKVDVDQLVDGARLEFQHELFADIVGGLGADTFSPNPGGATPTQTDTGLYDQVGRNIRLGFRLRY